MLFSLSACVSNTASNTGLPKGYDSDKIKTTCESIISYLNNDSYNEIINLFSENFKTELTADKLKDMCSEKVTAAGKKVN